MASAPAPADLAHVETWIFDLDNTLYAASTNLFSQIDRRMTDFIAKKYGLDRETAGQVRRAYFLSHGTTLSGLMEAEGLDPHEFLSYVHDIDLAPLDPRPELAAALARLPGRRLVYTNGSQSHAERVMAKLGIDHLFEAIHDIAAAGYCPKPERAAYEALLAEHAIAAPSAAMFEDMPRNLEAPHALGMTTVLVKGSPHVALEPHAPLPDYVHHFADDLAAFLGRARVRAPEGSAAKE